MTVRDGRPSSVLIVYQRQQKWQSRQQRGRCRRRSRRRCFRFSYIFYYNLSMKWCNNDPIATKNCCGYFNNKSMLKLKTNSPQRMRTGSRYSISYLGKLFRKLSVIKREYYYKLISIKHIYLGSPLYRMVSENIRVVPLF